ncbi:unnamed protein product [Alopecurus aequalis]
MAAAAAAVTTAVSSCCTKRENVDIAGGDLSVSHSPSPSLLPHDKLRTNRSSWNSAHTLWLISLSSLPCACRPKKAAKKGRSPPPEEEMEAFFAAAESDVARRFAAKYNYDVVKDAPMDGRYEWVRVRL